MIFFKKSRTAFLVMVGLIWILYAAAVLAAEDQIELYAASAALIDGESGRLLYGKEEVVPLPMASTTKIMTCIVALEQAELSLVCEVSANAAAQPRVKLGMAEGDSFLLGDLLYSLMLESHNDTAVCIAENVAGSVEEFAAMMNAKAAEIGCRNTWFVTPNGLDGEDGSGIHHTTAYDLAMIMRYCLTQSHMQEAFREVTAAQTYSFSNTKGTRSYSCSNHNALLTILDGAVSGKTGFTAKAGYCYVGAAEREGELLIVSLLACGWPNNKGYKWVDTKKLMKYGFDNFERRQIADQNLKTGPITVLSGKEQYTGTAVQWNGSETLPGSASVQYVLMRPEEQVEMQVNMEECVPAPVMAGSMLGSISYAVDGHIYASYPVTAQNTVEKQDYPWCLARAWQYWMLW